jgi:peroxiredoxin/tetratricopeptide (TPR) repeat protein
MWLMRYLAAVLCLVSTVAVWADDEPGHSKHGSAFDSGMRSRPWAMTGIGYAPFPITSKSPEVQKWFDQGNALLHSFWFEEAERSFRWCLKLDPDCAMAYWGLARTGFTWFDRSAKSLGDKHFDRYRQFLKEAVKRKDKVTDRERMYIEAWEIGFAPNVDQRPHVLVEKLEGIAVKYPDDIEAKALLALFNIGEGSALANQMLIEQVLAKNPMHPGAHHASIHNWDGSYGAQALKSCESYGKAAPGIGHALHMPGHVYSKLGMWREAAIAMDSATRTELRYMNDRLALPFETWNYQHNRNYLCYIQEQLGMAQASIQGARDLLASPRDPEYNPEDFGTAGQGLVALTRALIKFERWDEILRPGSIPWPKTAGYPDETRAFAETFAYAGLGKTKEARKSLAKLKEFGAKSIREYKGAEPYENLAIDTAEGQVLAAEGNLTEAAKTLSKAADEEQVLRDTHRYTDDPPDQPWPAARLLGDVNLRQGNFYLAIKAYDRALHNELNDGFTLAGLAQAYAKLGNRTEAEHYADRLEYVWAGADSSLKWALDVKALGLSTKPIGETIAVERAYHPEQLDEFGPSNWRPYVAPMLDVRDSEGKHVHLEDYKGKNVLLVFFLGSSCVHCVKQLETINKRAKEFENQNTVILAVCSAPTSQGPANDTHIRLLTDTNHENARRFASYDDFEEIELHSTILIDGAGRVRWKRTGGDPFSNVDFLIRELTRVNHEVSAANQG